MKHRIERLEKAAALRYPPKVKRPELKIYTKHIFLDGRIEWEGGKAPVDDDDKNRLIIEVVQTRPDPIEQNGTFPNSFQ